MAAPDFLRDPERLVAKLGTKLTVRGFPVTPEDTRKALEVLSQLPPDSDPEVVGRILAGVYARDEQTYEEFLRVWDVLIGRSPEEVKRGKPIPAGSDVTEEGKVSRAIVERVVRRMEREDLAPLSVEQLLRWYRVKR